MTCTMRRILGTRTILHEIDRHKSGLRLNASSFSNFRHCCIVRRHDCSKRLSSLFKSGRMEEAEKLFDRMPERNVVTWSIAIHGYAINGFWKKSVELLAEMRLLGLAPNSFTVVGVLISVQGLKDLVLARAIHGLIVKDGSASDLIVGTAMLDTYAKCGNISDSFKLFGELRNPGLVSYNAMIAGLINNEMAEEGILLFEKLRKSFLVPNTSTALSIIRGSLAFGLTIVCELVHGLILKLGLHLDISVHNSLLDMYSHSRDLIAAGKIFKEMEYKDVISWTIMMGLFVNLEYANEAVDLFFRMRKSGVACDAVVLINLISAVAIQKDLEKGRQVHAQVVVQGYGLEIPLLNSMIGMYSKCGLLDSSRTVFDQANPKSLVSWTAIISGYLQHGQPREALDIFHKAISEEWHPDSILLISALVASGELAALQLCQQLHCYSFKAGFSSYRLVQNTLVSSYSKCGNMNPAWFVFKEMGVVRNISSWNAIINGYGINGQGDVALSIFHEMGKVGEDFDSATYLSILTACSHAGLINEGLIIFTQMVEDSKINPSQEHCACIVDLLSRAGCLSDTDGFIGNFLERMGPNGWRSFLSGCMLHGNLALAEFAARKLFEQDPGDSGQVVLLSNVYASVGRFQDAEALRLSMHRKGLTKNPGVSLVNKSLYECG